MLYEYMVVDHLHACKRHYCISYMHGSGPLLTCYRYRIMAHCVGCARLVVR